MKLRLFPYFTFTSNTGDIFTFVLSMILIIFVGNLHQEHLHLSTEG